MKKLFEVFPHDHPLLQYFLIIYLSLCCGYYCNTDISVSVLVTLVCFFLLNGKYVSFTLSFFKTFSYKY